MKCSFCKRLAEHKQAEIAFGSVVTPVYSVALCRHFKYMGEVRARTVSYKKDGVGFPLKFCPECGKPVT